MDQGHQIEKLLGEVTAAQDESVRVEEEYKRSKVRAKEQLTTAVRRLAELADSQAVRAKILRELYWNRRVSADAIGDAFKMGMKRIAVLAGAYTVTDPCGKGCGGAVEKTFTARTELERHEASGWREPCARCKRLEEEESERRRAEERRENAERLAELHAMSWPEYADTWEWITLRNRALQGTGYGCEICETSGVGLTVGLHKDLVEYPVPTARLILFGPGPDDTRLYVLCQACLGRCEDLLHPERREYLKVEFINRIKNTRAYDDD